MDLKTDLVGITNTHALVARANKVIRRRKRQKAFAIFSVFAGVAFAGISASMLMDGLMLKGCVEGIASIICMSYGVFTLNYLEQLRKGNSHETD